MNSFLRPKRSVSWPKKQRAEAGAGDVDAPRRCRCRRCRCRCRCRARSGAGRSRRRSSPRARRGSRPSRGPITTLQWNRDQGSRSSRAGIWVWIVQGLRRRRPRCSRGARRYARLMLLCRLFGHRFRFAGGGGDDALALPARLRSRRRQALRERPGRQPLRPSLRQGDRDDLGRRAPLVGLLPLRLARAPETQAHLGQCARAVPATGASTDSSVCPSPAVTSNCSSPPFASIVTRSPGLSSPASTMFESRVSTSR